MRRRALLSALLLLLFTVGSHNADAGRPRCENTHCGWYCATHDHPLAGYCNPAEDSPSTGCIQLYGPDCASMDGASRCTSGGGAL